MLDDNARCYRHPDQPASVRCQRCERPICTADMIQASVGFHCPECTRTSGQRVIRGRDLRSSSGNPVTLALIAVNVVAFLVQGMPVGDEGRALVDEGFLFGPAVADGEWWRIVTSGFLHANLFHIGFNMYALWVFGQPVERGLGPVRFALVYLAGLLSGSAFVLFGSFDTPTLGASGAVLGLAGGLAAVLWSRGIAITQTSLAGLFVINLALPILIPTISFWGHFGGIVGGFAAGWLLSWLPGRFRWSQPRALAATVVLCIALAIVAVAIPTVVRA